MKLKSLNEMMGGRQMTDLEKRALLAIEKLRARIRELEGAGQGFAIVGYAVALPGRCRCGRVLGGAAARAAMRCRRCPATGGTSRSSTTPIRRRPARS